MAGDQTHPASERHNVATKPILQAMVEAVNADPVELLILAESLVLGVFLLSVKLGGDEIALDVFTERLRERMAEQRFSALQIVARS